MTSAKLSKIIKNDREYLFQNYGDRLPVCFIRGNGSLLYDQDDRQYIDFFSGIAVSNLGYGNSAITRAITDQANSIIHSSNWYFNRDQIKAAQLISELSFPGKTLFLNSGTEANEAALKLARKYGLSTSKKRIQIVSFVNSFHGRTMGSMSATGQKKIHTGFGPLVPGFIYLPYNDPKAAARELKKNRNIAAVIIEMVQGEGGILPADPEFVDTVFSMCRQNRILTIVDEVQTGIGRTGKIFAYQHYGVTPDIITIAKGLGGGVPVSALHARDDLASYLDRGSHGSTFGGNHLACAAAAAVLGEMKKKNFMNNVERISNFMFDRLEKLRDELDMIQDIRGMGLHIGVELDRPGMPFVTRALEEGLVINCTAERVLRITPPLNTRLSTVRAGMKILENILKKG